MTPRILAPACIALASATAGAATISQTNVTNDSGVADYGQEIRLDSSIFTAASSYTLDSVTFYKGDLGGGSATLFLDVYIAPDATEADPDVDTSTVGLTYLGSSTNSFDYGALTVGDGAAGTLGGQMTWTFSGIELAVDRDVFLIFSSDNQAGGFQGTSTSTNTVGVPASSVYTNIGNADSDPLFGGTGDASDQDHVYSVEVTAVPEPSIALLGGLGLLVLSRRRRA